MTAMNLAALIASAVSATLAVLAIALALVFYRLTARLAESVRQSEQGIAAGVSRLEKLFDTLYSDAQGLIRQAVEDLRGRAEKPAGLQTDLAGLKRDIVDGVSRLLESRARGQGVQPGDPRQQADAVAEIIDRAIAQSRQGS